MGISFDTSNDTAEEVNKGGGLVDKEGWYHFEVSDIETQSEVQKDGKDVTPSITVILTVLHSVNGQSPEGSKLYHRINTGTYGGKEEFKESSRKQVIKAALRLGVIREENGKLINNESNETGFTPEDFIPLKGRQVVAEVKVREPQEYTDRQTGEKKKTKVSYRVPFNEFFHPGDPEVKDVPKNEEMLNLMGLSSQPDTPGDGGDAHSSLDDALGDDF